ncbi:MAG: OadG family protein [Victivallales bacterium]|nr:OadG family protein [Victivallales bacterium]
MQSAFILLVAGMGTTLLFLSIQALLTTISAKVTAKFAYLMPEPEPKKPAAKKPAPKKEDSDSDELVAVLTAAAHYYQQNN